MTRKGVSQNNRTKTNTQHAHTTATWTTARASAAAAVRPRGRRASVGVVEARQKAAGATSSRYLDHVDVVRHGTAASLFTRRHSSVPSRGVVVVPQLTGVAGDDVSVQLDLVDRSTAHSTHARGSARTSFSSSVSERLNCSKSTLDLTDVRSTTINSLEIRAHVANNHFSAVRAWFAGKYSAQTKTGCSVARERYTGRTADVRAQLAQVRTLPRTAGNVDRRGLASRALGGSRDRYTRAHKKLTEK